MILECDAACVANQRNNLLSADPPVPPEFVYADRLAQSVTKLVNVIPVLYTTKTAQQLYRETVAQLSGLVTIA